MDSAAQRRQSEQQQQEQRLLGRALPEIEMYSRPTYLFRDVFNAFMDCRRRKRNKRSTIAFEVSFEENLFQLLDEINSGEYEVGRSVVFVVKKPKPREIWAANFKDRIVHHLVYNDINPFFEKRFIEDSFSCIVGRGTLAASDRLVKFHRAATNNYDSDTWYLQFDIKNFFGSINKDILWRLLEKHVKRGDRCYYLLEKIVFNDPTRGAIVQRGSEFSLVPPHKSLWNAPKNKGLPIGNLTSQFFSNVYLNELDQFIKHDLKAKFYIRYVDDAVIVSRDREYLLNCLKRIDEFLTKKLDIELHPEKCFVKMASQGIKFVGYIVKPYRRYTRRATVCAAKQVLSRIQKAVDHNRVCALNSYLGFFRNSSSYAIRKAICERAEIPTIIAYDRNYTKLIPL